MLEWVQNLRDALDRECGQGRRIATLATVDRAGAPHVRAVVCRRIDDDGRVYTATDARTEKNAQLRGDPRGEMCFWLPKVQVQFRVSGRVRIVTFPEDESLRRQIWHDLTDETRAIYFWPTPGIARTADDVFPEAVAADVAPPRTFEVLIMEPKLVDRLSLEFHPQHRRVWRADTRWAGVDVNP